MTFRASIEEQLRRFDVPFSRRKNECSEPSTAGADEPGYDNVLIIIFSNAGRCVSRICTSFSGIWARGLLTASLTALSLYSLPRRRLTLPRLACVPFVNGPVHPRRSIDLDGVDVGLLLDQRSKGGLIASHGGIRNISVSRPKRETRH